MSIVMERRMEHVTRELLVVEDSASEWRLIERHLARHLPSFETRWSLSHAPNMSEALSRLTEHRPCAVLLDLQLPDSEGLDTLRRIRAAIGTDPVVIVLSAREALETALAALAEGADDYLPKSLLSAELLHRVLAYAVERKHLRRLLAEAHRKGRSTSDVGQPSRNLLPMCEGLTRREVEVLRSVATGRTKKEIADEMRLSPRTIERHVSNVMQKVKLHDRVSLTRYAIREGLIDA